MKKHILVISQYFYPEEFRINDMCQEWVKRGYQVTVVTGIPNYPQGEFYEGYSHTSKRFETWQGIDIIRLPIRARQKGSLNLIRNYLSFVVEGYKWVKQTQLQADLVYTFEVSPMTQALVGIKYAKMRGVPHYLYVTDLWPENVAIITGITNKYLLYPIQKMVDYIYHNSQRIFTSSKSFMAPIYRRGVEADKVEFWPQYAEDYYKPVAVVDESVREHFDTERFNIVFAGNIGYAQGLSTLVEVANQLKEKGRAVTFVLIGDGRYKELLQREVSDQKLESNFLFIDRKPAQQIPAYLAMADALLISLSKSEVFSITIPSKTQSCLACGKPILVSADGEVQDIILEAGAGFGSPAEDANQLTLTIERLLAMSTDEREKLGHSALEYSRKVFNKEKLLNRLDEVFMGG